MFFKKNNNKPKKVPLILQRQALECGAACLAMILKFYKKHVPLEKLRQKTYISRDGSTALNLILAAKKYDLIANGYRLTLNQLQQKIKTPCILHWNFNHFVVLKGFKKNVALINDPAFGEYSINLDDFKKSFTGICLTFSPSKKFKPTNEKPTALKIVTERLKKSPKTILFISITSIITFMIGILNPTLQKILIDRVLTNKNENYIFFLTTILAVLGILNILNEWVKNSQSLKLKGKIVAYETLKFTLKILKLPLNFFSQILIGDILMRKKYISQVTQEFILTITSVFIYSIEIIICSLLMFIYNKILALISLTFFLINILIIKITSKKNSYLEMIKFRDETNLKNLTLLTLTEINTIKSNGAEDYFFKKWANLSTKINNIETENIKLNQYFGNLTNLVFSLNGAIVLIFSAYLIMKNKFTVGMVVAFNGFLKAFISPTTNLIEKIQNFDQIQNKIIMIDDILKYPTKNNKFNNNINLKKLSGDIELKNLTFSYSKYKKPIFYNVNLKIKKGQCVAFVGKAASGKSTILNIFSGLNTPLKGDVLFDGVSIKKINKAVFKNSVAIVSKNMFAINDSILNNIKLFSSSTKDIDAINAAKIAEIDSKIIEFGGYDKKILEEGENFSTGELQRLEIARALAQKPTILILDEATYAIDLKTKEKIIRSIKKNNITIILSCSKDEILNCYDLTINLESFKN